MPAVKPTTRVRFGGFELDLTTGELWPVEPVESGGKVVLREQPFRVLRMLIERGGEIVTREEIKKRLWPNDTVVDFDHSINAVIKVLRRALGDSADNPRYIGTLARRGYRLLVSPEWLEPDPESPRGAANGTHSLPPGSSLIGKMVSHYRVLEVIGGGGMGMVYKAEDIKLGRLVALKFLPEEVASDPIALRRFEREAQTASALNHPNICTIYEIEEYGGHPCIVMELLEGETLLHHLNSSASKTMSLIRFLDTAIQICDGLQAAHDKGIIHRDIKPANIFLTKQGPVKILDFGLAKLASGQEIARTDTVQETPDAEGPGGTYASLTRTGATMGTAGYMSPEQVRKEKLDARSDLFSFGLVLYEAAVGRRAFPGETAELVHHAIRHQTVPRAHDLNSAVPRKLGAVIAKALEKDPALRYQSCAEMRREVERVRKATQPARERARKWVAAAALLVVLALVSWMYVRSRNRIALSAHDTVVLAVDNQTGEPAFNDAMYSSLLVALGQTPYLNVLGAAKVSETLRALDLSVDPTRVTAQMATRVCLHTNSKLVIAGSLTEAGNNFRIELAGIDCKSGKTIAREQKDSPNRSQVINLLGVSAAQLRRRLGEPTESVARFNQPLDEATSASPEAIQLLTEGYRRSLAFDIPGAIPFYQRAIEIDPNLALAHSALAGARHFMGDETLAAEAGSNAFALRDRLTMQARFITEATYYTVVTGEQEKARVVLAQWVQTYPDDFMGHHNFGVCLLLLGRPDQALAEFREALRLNPNAFSYHDVIRTSIYAGRFDEAQATFAEADARNIDSPRLRSHRLLLAFLKKDDAAMQEQWRWAMGKPDFEYLALFGRAQVGSYYGRVRESRSLIDQAREIAKKAGATSSINEFDSWELSSQVETGNFAPVRRDADKLLNKAKDREDRLSLALIFARAGDVVRAQKLADRASRDAPLDTQVQDYCLPAIRAAIKLDANDPAGAVELLRPAEKYELAFSDPFNSIYPAYIRGLAYLQMGEGRLASAEFQKLVDHPGLVGRDIIGALSRLQIARAQKLSGKEAAAQKSYEAFLMLWKDADPDLPVYQQAKAEYAKLRLSANPVR